jgi:hypothetical protein
MWVQKQTDPWWWWIQYKAVVGSCVDEGRVRVGGDVQRNMRRQGGIQTNPDWCRCFRFRLVVLVVLVHQLQSRRRNKLRRPLPFPAGLDATDAALRRRGRPCVIVRGIAGSGAVGSAGANEAARKSVRLGPVTSNSILRRAHSGT